MIEEIDFKVNPIIDKTIRGFAIIQDFYQDTEDTTGIQVTEWLSQDGIDIDIYINPKSLETKHYKFTYDELCVINELVKQIKEKQQ